MTQGAEKNTADMTLSGDEKKRIKASAAMARAADLLAKMAARREDKAAAFSPELNEKFGTLRDDVKGLTEREEGTES